MILIGIPDLLTTEVTSIPLGIWVGVVFSGAMAIDQDRVLEAFAEDKLAMRRSDRAEQTLELAMAFGAMRCAYCALRAIPL